MPAPVKPDLPRAFHRRHFRVPLYRNAQFSRRNGRIVLTFFSPIRFVTTVQKVGRKEPVGTKTNGKQLREIVRGNKTRRAGRF
jgi:hypothetical protein